jgi:hypothetical protein
MKYHIKCGGLKREETPGEMPGNALITLNELLKIGGPNTASMAKR